MCYRYQKRSQMTRTSAWKDKMKECLDMARALLQKERCSAEFSEGKTPIKMKEHTFLPKKWKDI